MARKTAEIRITAEGRDKDKRFLITEMAARAQVDWAMRAVFALGNAGVIMPAGWQEMDAEIVLASIGVSAIGRIDPDSGMPLLNELLSCVQCVTSADVTRTLHDSDIDEAATYFRLYDEVAALHLGFFPGEKLRTLVSVALRMLNWKDIQTSPGPSE